MTTIAVILVLVAAFAHATWNLFAKKAGGGALLVWLSDGLAALIFAPLAIGFLILERPRIGWLEITFILGSAVLHLVYFILLQRGYGTGDLSLVYPLARGTGPMLSTLTAILIFNERPSFLALLGAFLIALGVFILTGGINIFRNAGSRWAVGYGFLTGVLIASYTLWDKQAVSSFKVAPILLYYFSILARTGLLFPFALRNWGGVAALWKARRLEAFGVAFLSPFSYFLVLIVLVSTPVSYVAPAREISILIGALLGARFLSEGDAPRRIFAASLMLVGVVSLALG